MQGGGVDTAAAGRPLRVLVVEDSENDALLLLRVLERGGHPVQARRVDSAAGLAAALADAEWDVVLCDVVLPGFGGEAAVAMVRARSPELPVILVSGVVDEDDVVGAMRAGACDFVMKARPARLLPVLERELGEARARAARRQTEQALAASDERLLAIIEQMPFAVQRYAPDGTCLQVNAAWTSLWGAERSAAVGWNILTAPDTARLGLTDLVRRIFAGEALRLADFEWDPARLDRHGEARWVDIQACPIRAVDGTLLEVVLVADDVTARKRAVDALHTSRAQLEALVRDIDGIVWEGDAGTFGFTFVSDQAERLLGYPVADWLCDGFWQSHVHPDDFAAAARYCEEATRDLRNHAFEYRMRAADGRWLWIRDVVSVIPENGRPARIRGILLDVTAQKQAEAALRASEQRLRALVERAGESIALIDAQGTVTYMSPSTSGILGRHAEDRLGRPAFDNVHPDDVRLFDDVFTVPGRVVEGRVRVRHADGEWHWVEGTVRNLLHDPVVGAVVANFRDVTQRVRAEAQIETLNRELEGRVSERTAELEAAVRELEAFSYSVSHDLRAPLRAIDGFTRILREEHAGELSAAGRRQLDRVVAAAGRMGKLIDHLLHLSRVGRAEVRRRRVDLGRLGREILAELRAAQPERRVAVAVADGLTACADPTLCRAVLENLLGNAWKYTARQAEARIEFGADDAPDGRVYFVRDNGAGFDMAYADKLFAPFQRLHGEGEFEGSGVGLATVQRIVHRHGGRIWAEAAPGCGATFFFTLERASAPR